MTFVNFFLKFASKTHFLSKKAVRSSYTFKNSSEAILRSQGREQFEKLVNKGLSIPVAYL